MHDIQSWASVYIDKQRAALAAVPVEQVSAIIQRIQEAWRDGRQIFICGNGGSGANASHLATDLGKSAGRKLSKRFRCMALTDNTSLITATGNDIGFEDIFSEQLAIHADRDDLLIGLSVSGDSPNMLAAFEWGAVHSLHMIALVGKKAGRISELADICIKIEDDHYGRVEDAQMTICHMIAYAFIEMPKFGRQS